MSVQPEQARASVASPLQRIRACFSHRQHAEQVSTLFVLLVIQIVAELHLYAAIGIVSLVTVGCRDLLIILLFAEEEGIIR